MTASSDFEDQIADYVLGLLEDTDRARFEERMARDPELARRVGALQERMHALDETVEPLEVPPELWARIERSLERGASIPVPAIANTARSGTALPRWAGMAAAVVLSLGIGFFGGQIVRPEPPQPLVVAVLVGDDMTPGAIVEAFADDSVRIVPLEALVAPPNSTLEMWTLPDPETGPVSLGTFQEARDLVLGGPDLPAPRPEQLYEITVEPEGGSPTGRPTGPILLKGYARSPVI